MTKSKIFDELDVELDEVLDDESEESGFWATENDWKTVESTSTKTEAIQEDTVVDELLSMNTFSILENRWLLSLPEQQKLVEKQKKQAGRLAKKATKNKFEGAVLTVDDE